MAGGVLREQDRADRPSGAPAEFPLQPGYRTPYALVAGPDGAMWFTDDSPASIGRITTEGTLSLAHTGPIIDGAERLSALAACSLRGSTSR